MAVSVRIDINGTALNRLLRSPTGPVARDMLRRGHRVQAAARRRINSRTGALSRSIEVSIIIVDRAAGVQIGTDLHYARFVHDGTGVYGPTRRPIRPTRRRALAFGGVGGDVVVASSQGQRGTHFLRNALRAAR